MDPLKKLVADRLKTQVAGAHPHAEVLSAFAENALPESERESVLQHLSACSDCRDIIFLAAPLAAESQQVVSAPKPRPVFALRWGTLAACIVIATVFLVSRHEAPRNEQLAKSAPQAGTSNESHSVATDTIVAAGKTPAELREMRDRVPAKVGLPTPSTGHAEPKHITAKPEGNMSFADSGEVSVNGPATLDRKVAARAVQDLPTMAGNVAGPRLMSPAVRPRGSPPQVAATASVVNGGAVQGLNVGGRVQEKTYAYTQNSADFGMKGSDAVRGSVSGTVVDASGAVIPNVKVTALGPLGTKTATSDQSGKYEIRELAAGNYRLKFDAPGFQETQLQQVAVAQKPANVDVKLNPGATAETAEITAAAPSVVQQAQQEAISQNDQQQQALNQIQDLQVEAAVVKVPKAAKKNKDRLKQTAADTWDAPIWHWSVSPQGAVQRSSDLGKTWQPVTVNQNAIFRAVSSIGPQVWVGGNGGALYHSSDSGLHWTQVVPGAGEEKLQADIIQIQFVDPQHLTLTTSASQVWTTSDGGQSWARK